MHCSLVLAVLMLRIPIAMMTRRKRKRIKKRRRMRKKSSKAETLLIWMVDPMLSAIS